MTFREQLAALIYDTELKYRERTAENTDYGLLDELAERIAAAFEPIDVHGTAYRFLPPDESHACDSRVQFS